MKRLRLSKGFKTIFSGQPDLSVIRLSQPDTVAVSAMDIPFVRPKLLVKENDPVKIGTPLFCDKRNDCINYVSPGGGTIKKIVFGPRRRLMEVIIALDKPMNRKSGDKPGENEQSIEFDSISQDAIETTDKADLIKKLQQGGLWQCFREFPFKDTADETRTPSMIIVSLNGNDPFSPHPGLVLDGEKDFFNFGLKVLKRLTSRIIVTAREGSLDRLGSLSSVVTHEVPDIFPSWDPGVVLYKMKTTTRENHSWTISAEHLILVAKFLLTGRYPIKRVIAVTRPNDKKPHIITRQGAPVNDLAGKIDTNSLITTGRFNGRAVDPGSHLGFFESTLNVISESDHEELFGFMRPGLDRPTVSRTFLSSLFSRPKELDCNLHGEERACINCSYCSKICPVDLMPSFIMKALHADDIEDALELGLLDCCRCGLCSYTCPSKIELTHILSQGIDMHYKDKE